MLTSIGQSVTSLANKLPFPALHDDDSPNWLNLRSAVGPLRHAPPFWIANSGTKNATRVFSYVMSVVIPMDTETF